MTEDRKITRKKIMILNDKETTLAYRCPHCGKFIFGMVGLFTLTGDMLKLKCDCGRSEVRLINTANGKVKITVPCLFCADAHTYILSRDAFFEKEILALSCSYSGLDTCFVGKKENVSEAASEADEILSGILEEAGFESFDEFIASKEQTLNTDGDPCEEDLRFDYAQVEETVHFMLTELTEDGDISCLCRDGENPRYDFEFQGDGVRIFCRTCGAELHVPMASTSAASDFLHTDKLVLTHPRK